jgi:hypothetical protein
VYKAITGISQSAPCLITCPSHGLVNGSPFTVIDVKGMTQINAKFKEFDERDFYRAKVADIHTIEINSLSSASYSTYEGGGYVRYFTPIDFTGMTARMHLRAKIKDTVVLDTLTTENSRVIFDNVGQTITLLFPEATTTAYAFSSAVYDLEIVTSNSVVPLLQGSVIVGPEVTR